jgi:hypothetical protein
MFSLAIVLLSLSILSRVIVRYGRPIDIEQTRPFQYLKAKYKSIK